jgi:hypothetical protein
VEATCIVGTNFEEAVKAGTKEFEEAKAHPERAIIVDIRQMRQSGIQPIDLPKVSDSYLTDLGYQFVPKQAPVVTPKVAAARKADNGPSPTPEPDRKSNEGSVPQALVGNWAGIFKGQQGQTIRATLTLKANGTMSYLFEAQFANGETRKMQGSGQWKVCDKSLVMTDDDGVTYFPYELKEIQLSIFIAPLGVEVNFQRT